MGLLKLGLAEERWFYLMAVYIERLEAQILGAHQHLLSQPHKYHEKGGEKTVASLDIFILQSRSMLRVGNKLRSLLELTSSSLHATTAKPTRARARL